MSQNGVRMVIGANRGIGLALTAAQLRDPRVTRVIATHRQGADVRQLSLVVAIHPGTTDTDLSRPYQNSVEPGRLFTPEQTAKRLLNVIEGTDSECSGAFLNWDGNPVPW